MIEVSCPRQDDRAGAHRTTRPLFANPAAVVQSWYPVARSRTIGRGRARSVDLLDRRVVVYRDRAGHAHVADAQCPHLGADLGLGRVDANGLRCAFHGWCFDADGRCVHAPDHEREPARRLRTYPAEERWGLIWMFNGPAPQFPLPDTPPAETWWSMRLPPQTIACHPHIVLGNGLDLTHYDTLHGMTFTSPPGLDTSRPYEVAVEIRGRPRSRVWQAIAGAWRRDVVARFATIGGSIAWTEVIAPIRFAVVFTGRPDRIGHCVTQTIFLFPRGTGLTAARAFGLMAMLLHDDRQVLDSIAFTPRFTDRDAPMRAFADVVDDLGTW